MSPCLHGKVIALICCLGLLLLVPATFAAPAPFARVDLYNPQELRNMSVSTLEVIDLMDLSQSRVTLLSTIGDGSDTKIIPYPSIRTVRRVFSERAAFCKNYTLTILGPLDSTVPVSEQSDYVLFIRNFLPVVRCQVPGVTADVVMAKINGSTRQMDISDLISSTDMAYLLQDPRGVLAIQQHPQVIGAYGSWTSADYNASDMTFTFVHNQFDIADYTLDPGIARKVSNLTPFISGTPPLPGEYLLSAFRYTPLDQKVTTYVAWPVVILEGDNRFVFMGKSAPYQYDLMSGEDLVLTFENPTRVNNLTYILIKDSENYDARVDVNMTALEELPAESGLDVILSGNPVLSLLKDSGASSPVLQNVISYSITRQGSPPPIQPPHNHEINITPGYGISGYALNSTYVVIGQDDLTTLKEGSFSVYSLAMDKKNDIVALDHGILVVGCCPEVSFTGYPLGGKASLPVQFTDTCTGSPTSWNWNFGDGTANDTTRNPSHLYQDPGTFDVTLTASNGFGSETMTMPAYINVTEPGLRADFSGNPTSGNYPLTVQFTDTSVGPHDRWNWDFGDSGSSAEQHPVHTYRQVRTYNVSLTVSNATLSDTLTRSSYIRVFSSGGGGGGGGGYVFSPTVNATPTPTQVPNLTGKFLLGLDNRTIGPVIIISPDGIVTLSLGTGVAVSGANGRSVTGFTLEQVAEGSLAQLPSGYTPLQGIAYTLLPLDVVIDPVATLKFSLSGDQWTNLAGKDLVLVWYDAGSGSWLPVNTRVDTVAKTVSADITKGGIFALVIRGPVPTVQMTPDSTPIPTMYRTQVPTGVIPWTIIIPVLVVVMIVLGAVTWYFLIVRKRKRPDE